MKESDSNTNLAQQLTRFKRIYLIKYLETWKTNSVKSHSRNWVCTNIKQEYIQARLGYSIAQLGTTVPINQKVDDEIL